jgi:kumamolisin
MWPVLAAIVALASLPAFALGKGSATHKTEVPATRIDQVARALQIGHVAANTSLDIIVALNFSHPEAIEAYNAELNDPASPNFRQFLTPKEIGERFGPAQADYDAVVAHLQANGLTITKTPENRMTVHATGTAAQMESAFGVKINTYRESHQDRVARGGPDGERAFFSIDRNVQLPDAIAPMVTSVEGLQNYTHPILLLHHLKKASSPFAPADVRTAYNNAPLFSGGDTGSGRTVAISNWDGLNLTNAGDFVTKFGLPTPLSGGQPTNVTIENVAGDTTSTSGEGEGDLDPQMVLGQAPLATIIIYSNPSGSSPLAVLEQEVSDNKADIISESYGWSLSSSAISSCHTQHTMMTTQGITYLCASGDSGSKVSPYWYPDVDPNITVVGGTDLTVSSTGARSTETGWSDSGGGTSSTGGFTKPSWQTGTGVPSTTYRVFPDVSSNATGSKGAYQFYYEGKDQTGYVGTSFASPVTAAMLAEVEQYMIAKGKITANSAGKYRLGNINSYLYSYIGNTSILYDVTSGKNGSYSCTKGWDYVTGVGTLNFDNLATTLP